ncbi:hypothetical protein BHE74_00031497 [Ensete ventricosum]|nr:hypothetical protein BHE74_00031497 [Ensete ventricosum]
MDPSRAASTPSHGPPGDGGGPAPEFPAGLRVLLVDDDPTCLKILDRMLRKCLYHGNANPWLLILVFRMIEAYSVLLMCSDDLLAGSGGALHPPREEGMVRPGVTHGACDYIIKPVRMESLKNIWQHVVRKKRNELKELENSGSVEEDDKHKRSLDDGDNASSGCVGNWKNAKRKKEEKDEEEEEMVDEHDDSSNTKKPRVVCIQVCREGEDEVGDGGEEDAQKEEKGPGDHCALSIGLVDAYPPEAGWKLLSLLST